MSSRTYPGLFETTHSALLLPCPIGAGLPPSGSDAGGRKSNLDKSFWIMRELGRYLGGVDHRVGLLDLARCPERIPT